jgi:predicted AAA+ superfamily ATPase
VDRSFLEFVVSDQFDSLKAKDKGFSRSALLELSDFVAHKSNIVVMGHRRCGKSTLLFQIMEKFFPNAFYYLNFADERLNDFEAKDFQVLHEIFIKKFGEKKTFFFDEIQGKPGWNKFVNRLYENGCKFFITGSNSELLSKEISTFLTGRHLDFVLFPFSFKEFLGFKGINRTVGSTKEKAVVLKALDEFIAKGGFPEVLVYGNMDVLEKIYEDVINKDILVRYKIKDEKTFKDLALYLVSNSSKDFSYNSLKKQFNLGSSNTVKSFVYYLTNCFLLVELNRFFYSLKRQEMAPKKIYCIDTGMINKMGFKFSEDKGRLFENLVFVELLRRKKNVFYWKDANKKEIDFLIVEKNQPVQAIQVCADLSNEKTNQREIAGLLSALNEFKLKKGQIITYDTEKIEKHENKTIQYIPLWKWLLE